MCGDILLFVSLALFLQVGFRWSAAFSGGVPCFGSWDSGINDLLLRRGVEL